MWGVARRAGAEILLRVEDHDRQRSRETYVEAILENLDWLGFEADAGPVRQTSADAVDAYERALEALAAAGRAYRCACTRSTFAAWAREHGRDWRGPGCPGGCRARSIDDDTATSVRIVLGDGRAAFEDLRLGPQVGPVAATGDPVARDRSGNWTYGYAVVVDDLRQGVDLIIRGEDLLTETPNQVRLGELLGRRSATAFLHHPLIRKEGGAKLSKSDGDTGVRELRAAGWSPEEVRAVAAARGGIPAEVVAAAGDGRGRRHAPGADRSSISQA